MALKRILIIFGTRPEAIKLAPVWQALKEIDSVEVEVCATGQHKAMLEQVLGDFQPNYNLSIMKEGQDLTDITVLVLDGLRSIFSKQKFDLVIIQGDTTTTFAAALAAFYNNIPVAHVEAGLRTRNLLSPFPEEGNRQMVSRIASVHFCPTKSAKAALIAEGVDASDIHIVGNTVVDTLHQMLDNLRTNMNVPTLFPFLASQRRLLLVTLHRRENFGPRLEQICRALIILSQREDVHIVLPVHLNPILRSTVHTALSAHSGIYLIDPVPHLEFIYLMSHAYLTITDSGGIQEEAPSIGVPCLVTRDVTERPEGVEAGCVTLVGADCAAIVREASRLLDDPQAHAAMARATNPYGDGKAGPRIAAIIAKML